MTDYPTAFVEPFAPASQVQMNGSQARADGMKKPPPHKPLPIGCFGV